jgi:hypothetical protein
LVIWEPILATDFWQPSGITMARIPDTRVRQFWDRSHVVSAALKEILKQKPAQPQPGCCTAHGFYWDDAILFPPNAKWKDPPAREFWNGPVVRIIPDLEKALNEQPK